jgi:hypothetical protein
MGAPDRSLFGRTANVAAAQRSSAPRLRNVPESPGGRHDTVRCSIRRGARFARRRTTVGGGRPVQRPVALVDPVQGPRWRSSASPSSSPARPGLGCLQGSLAHGVRGRRHRLPERRRQPPLASVSAARLPRGQCGTGCPRPARLVCARKTRMLLRRPVAINLDVLDSGEVSTGGRDRPAGAPEVGGGRQARCTTIQIGSRPPSSFAFPDSGVGVSARPPVRPFRPVLIRRSPVDALAESSWICGGRGVRCGRGVLPIARASAKPAVGLFLGGWAAVGRLYEGRGTESVPMARHGMRGASSAGSPDRPWRLSC